MTYCDNIPDFYVWSEPRARKVYTCCECRGRIERGEKYFKATGSWEHVVSTHRQHLLCCQVCIHIRDNFYDYEECVPFGEMWEAVGELSVFMDPRHTERSVRQLTNVKQLRQMLCWIRLRLRAQRYGTT